MKLAFTFACLAGASEGPAGTYCCLGDLCKWVRIWKSPFTGKLLKNKIKREISAVQTGSAEIVYIFLSWSAKVSSKHLGFLCDVILTIWRLITEKWNRDLQIVQRKLYILKKKMSQSSRLVLTLFWPLCWKISIARQFLFVFASTSVNNTLFMAGWRAWKPALEYKSEMFQAILFQFCIFVHPIL